MRSRPWREAEFASLDFETTGLDRERDAVVSFGVVPVRSGRVVVGESVHQLVVPEVPSSPESMRIHGILRGISPTRSRSRSRGKCSARRSGAGSCWLGSRAWRSGSWAGSTVGDGGRGCAGPSTSDRWRSSWSTWIGTRQSLSSAAERYGVPVANPHEALDDAMVTAQLFLVLASRLEERGFGSTRSFLRLTEA